MTEAPRAVARTKLPRPFKLRPPPPPRETSIQSAILDALRYLPYVRAWRSNAAAGRLVRRDGSASRFLRFGRPGQADITGTLSIHLANGTVLGLRLEIEVKRPGAELRPDQDDFAAEMLAAGCVHLVATSATEAMELVAAARDVLTRSISA